MDSHSKLPSFVRKWRAFTYALGLVRFNVIVLIVVWILLWVDQGQDLIRSVDEGHEFWGFILGMLLWGGSIWLWARTLLDIDFPALPFPEDQMDFKSSMRQVNNPSEELCSYNFWRKHLPRVTGFVSFIVIAVATARVGAYGLSITALLIGVAFWAFVIYRRDLTELTIKLLSKKKSSQKVKKIECNDLPPFSSLRQALGGYRGRLALMMWILGILYFIAGTLWPYYLGKLGAAVLLFLWAATFLPLGSSITYWNNKTGVPGLLLIMIAAGIFSLWNDNHDIREIAPSYSSPSKVRPTIHQALIEWKKLNCDGNSCKPFIVVATAGGGIRAAYWTAVVLGEMEDKHPGFHNQIFAISGVSGGSVGATVYRTVSTYWNDIDQTRCAKNKSIRDCTLNIIGGDKLGSVAASMLSSDLLQRFWPWPWFPDRAKAFEITWEKHYKKRTGRNDLENISFSDFSSKSMFPGLFLNSTWSDNGRRIVASSFGFKGVPQFERNNDLIDITGKNLRLSTAMHNSARFPLVSPPGSWSRKGKIQGRLMDGGLFENYGAETAIEILDTAKVVIGASFDPRIVLISSDPSVGKELASSPHRPPLKFGYEVLSTFATYARARVGHGSEAAARLKRYTLKKDQFAHFHMCKQNTKVSPPLGWSLSDKAKNTILGYLVKDGGSDETKCRPENQETLKTIMSWLK